MRHRTLALPSAALLAADLASVAVTSPPIATEAGGGVDER